MTKFQKGNTFGNRFTSENQPSREAKSEGRKEKYAYRDACSITLNKNQEFMLADLAAVYADASPEQKVKILEHLATFSGQKPTEKVESDIQVQITRKSV